MSPSSASHRVDGVQCRHGSSQGPASPSAAHGPATASSKCRLLNPGRLGDWKRKKERDGKRDGERPVTAPRQYYERCSRVFQCHLMPTRPFNTFQFYVSFPIFSRHARGRNRLRYTVDLYCLRESVCLDHVTGDNAIRLFV